MGVIGEPVEISSEELVQMLVTPEISSALLVLDCRPFLAFSRAHIRCAYNAAWNSLLRRRCSRGTETSARLDCLLADRSLLGRVRTADFRHIVVLDESSRALADLERESLAGLLLCALQREVHAGTARICLLQGGFGGFIALYPELCVSAPGVCGSQTTLNDSESRVSGRTTPLYDQGGPVEILPFLFLGSAHHSSQRELLRRCGITAVLNVSSSCPNLFENELNYMTLRVEDSMAADIRVLFPQAIHFIDSVKENGGRVLVHCQAGISRSATICLAYLIHARRVSLNEAFEFVKRRRNVISPNLGFMGQLLQFETDVLCPYTVLDSEDGATTFQYLCSDNTDLS
ncbi:Dual specificity protein phosphatase 2 [Bagarius yarrelli]|uniref:Dual specificity protein phosphatase 2 n=1 Tax=Bagarius yarrelli TaxID=175774 RepID=A0A556UFS4_BAGYA|nr:Dual specificity protein phosphatase 2 [Bagarius yarrelli]